MMKLLLYAFGMSMLLLASCKDENTNREIAVLQNQVKQLKQRDSSLTVTIDSLLASIHAAAKAHTPVLAKAPDARPHATSQDAAAASTTPVAAAEPAKPAMSKAEANYKKLHSWECSKCHKVADIDNKPKPKPCPKGGMHDWQ
jgi:hypothetical protein